MFCDFFFKDPEELTLAQRANRLNGHWRIAVQDLRCDLNSPDKLFDRRWAQTLLDRVLDRLDGECASAGKAVLFRELRPFLMEDAATGDYPISGAKLNMKPGAVAVTVHRLRERYRELLREEIVPTIADAGETEREMQYILRSFSA